MLVHLPHLISIIVPVYNEARTVAAVIDRLLAIDLPAPREIVVVNDGSTDGTREVLDGIAQRPGLLRIVHADANGGKGSAIRIGFAQARGTVVAIQDADLELDPAQLADAGAADSRRPDASGLRLALPGRAPAGAVAVGAGEPGADRGDQPALRRAHHRHGDLLQDHGRPTWRGRLRLEANRFDIEPEITAKLLRAGHAILELPVTFEPRSRAPGQEDRLARRRARHAGPAQIPLPRMNRRRGSGAGDRGAALLAAHGRASRAARGRSAGPTRPATP